MNGKLKCSRVRCKRGDKSVCCRRAGARMAGARSGSDFNPTTWGLVDESGNLQVYYVERAAKSAKKRADIEAMLTWVKGREESLPVFDYRRDELFKVSCELSRKLGRKESACARRSKSVSASKAALKSAPVEVLRVAKRVEDDLYDSCVRYIDSGYRRPSDVFYTMSYLEGNLRDNYGLEKTVESRVLGLELPWEEKSALMKVFNSRRSARIVWDRLLKSGRFETCIGASRRGRGEARGLCLKEESR